MFLPVLIPPAWSLALSLLNFFFPFSGAFHLLSDFFVFLLLLSFLSSAYPSPLHSLPLSPTTRLCKMDVQSFTRLGLAAAGAAQTVLLQTSEHHPFALASGGFLAIAGSINYLRRQSFARSWKKQLEGLDPKKPEDTDIIIKRVVGHSHPFEMFLALNFCFYRTFCRYGEEAREVAGFFLLCFFLLWAALVSKREPCRTFIFSFFFVCSSPTIAGVYRNTGAIIGTTNKRALDTDLLMHIWMDFGLDS